MRVPGLILAALLALAACSKTGSSSKAPGGADAGEPVNPPPPASAPTVGGVDLSGDLKMSGAAPRWTLEVGADALKLERPGKPDLTAKNNGPLVGSDGATWTAAAGDGTPLKITIAAAPCTDATRAMLPLTATVSVGSETLKGCATGELVKVDDHPTTTAPSGPPVDVE